MRIAFDPGNTGAIAMLNSKLELIAVEDMPVMVLGKNKTQVNAVEVSKILAKWQSLSSEQIVAFVEDVHTMPGQGVSSSGNFMFGKGVLVGVLAAMRIPYLLVTPQSWKKRAGLIGKDKDACRTLMQQFYPNAELGRKKDIGRADAIAIARFGSET